MQHLLILQKKDGSEATGRPKARACAGSLGILPPPPGGVKIAPPPVTGTQKTTPTSSPSHQNLPAGGPDFSDSSRPGESSWGEFATASISRYSAL